LIALNGWLKANPGELPKEGSEGEYHEFRVRSLYEISKRLRGEKYKFSDKIERDLKARNPDLFDETVRIVRELYNKEEV
jgi:hypothetical protein